MALLSVNCGTSASLWAQTEDWVSSFNASSKEMTKKSLPPASHGLHVSHWWLTSPPPSLGEAIKRPPLHFAHLITVAMCLKIEGLQGFSQLTCLFSAARAANPNPLRPQFLSSWTTKGQNKTSSRMMTVAVKWQGSYGGLDCLYILWVAWDKRIILSWWFALRDVTCNAI